MESYLNRCLAAKLCWVALLATGCIGANSAPTEPAAHVQPEHWPADMSDTADKIEARIDILKAEPGAEPEFSELAELISWAAEVAADTDLDEQEWTPIYELSESLRKQLLSTASLTQLQGDIERLVELLRQSHSAVTAKRESQRLAYPDIDLQPDEAMEP